MNLINSYILSYKLNILYFGTENTKTDAVEVRQTRNKRKALQEDEQEQDDSFTGKMILKRNYNGT